MGAPDPAECRRDRAVCRRWRGPSGTFLIGCGIPFGWALAAVELGRAVGMSFVNFRRYGGFLAGGVLG